MEKYCIRCRVLHSDNEMCIHHLRQLKTHPELLGEAAKFTSVAAQHQLVSSQTLDNVAKGVNKLIGSNLSYEGTHQVARDIQVFKQLNIDSYSRCGVFSDPQNAQIYLKNASKGQSDLLLKKLNGTGQEVDWLRFKQGHLSSLVERSRLLGEEMSNAPGVDGVTINRFTGKVVERTTVKAAQDSSGLGTNVRDVLKALEKGTLDPKDTLVGIEGSKDGLAKALEKNIKKATDSGNVEYANRLKEAQKHLTVKEIDNYENVKESTNRLTEKVRSGQAYTNVTMQEVGRKAIQGAVIGAAVSLTISGITNYLEYKNGEITEREAFENVSQDSIKGALVGAAMGTVTLFLPAGALGFVAGMGIGIYINSTCTNVLDEIYGKGAYGEILNSSGFIYGTTVNLENSIKEIHKDERMIEVNRRKTKDRISKIDNNFDEFAELMKR